MQLLYVARCFVFQVIYYDLFANVAHSDVAASPATKTKAKAFNAAAAAAAAGLQQR